MALDPARLFLLILRFAGEVDPLPPLQPLQLLVKEASDGQRKQGRLGMERAKSRTLPCEG